MGTRLLAGEGALVIGWTIRALLVRSGGHARTTTIEIDAFTIRGDDELHAPIDFPASSFF